MTALGGAHWRGPGSAGAARTAAEPAPGVGGLPGLRQHAGAARAHGLRHDRGVAGRHLQAATRTWTAWPARWRALETTGGPSERGRGHRRAVRRARRVRPGRGGDDRRAHAAGRSAGRGGRGARAAGGAALLHDVGHLRNETTRQHGDAGARWLSQWFGEAVTEPVRLHVAAKRYLCATEPRYFGLLSQESVRTLALQGGPMTAGRQPRSRRCRSRGTRWRCAAGTTRPRTRPSRLRRSRTSSRCSVAWSGRRRAREGVDRDRVAHAERHRAAQVAVIGPFDRHPGQVGREAALAQHRHPRADVE